MFATSKTVLIATAALVGLAGGTAKAQHYYREYRTARPVVEYRTYRPVVVVAEPLVYVSTRHETIDRLSRRLERDARILNRETDTHFRRTPSYRVFESQVDEIVRLSDHIHDVAHRGGRLHHLRDDVARLNSLFRSSARLFDSMAEGCRLDRETVIHIRVSLDRVGQDIAVLRSELY